MAEHSIDISKVWDIMDQHFQGFMAELYDLMWELRVPLYISTSIQPGEGEENGENQGGERPLNFPSVESACRAIRAMADHYSFRQL